MTRREELIETIKRLPRGVRAVGTLFNPPLILEFVDGDLEIFGIDAQGRNYISTLYWDFKENKELFEEIIRAAVAARELVEIED